MDKGITLYPSGWYYNACVLGFMEVLEYGLGKDAVNSFYQQDGTLYLPPEVVETIYSTPQEQAKIPIMDGCESPLNNLKRIAWWWVVKSKLDKVETLDAKEIVIETCNYMLGYKRFYPSLLIHNAHGSRIEFLNKWFLLNDSNSQDIDSCYQCSFCNDTYDTDFAGREFDNFFSNTISRLMGTSVGNFPNAFWGAAPNMVLCKVCRGILLFFHIIFQNRLFINAQSFRQIEQLNGLLVSSQQHYFNKNFLISLLRSDRQMKQALGSWQKQGIDMVLLSYNEIEEIYLSAHVTEIIFHPTVSGWLKYLDAKNDRNALMYLVRGEYEKLAHDIYRAIRGYVNPEKNKMVHVKKCVALIRIYDSIKRLVYKRGRQLVSIDDVMKLPKESYPANLLKMGSQLRLLEMVRLGQRQDIQYFLLRAYVAEGKQIPDTVAATLQIRDLNEFKNKMFAFVTGLAGKFE